jgi:4-hydroxybutyryl-CoA dehydratase/vinylacetyl-CoA-Delta-isomerase
MDLSVGRGPAQPTRMGATTTMAIRTAAQHLQGLRDGRAVYYWGELVEDVTTHAELGIGARRDRLQARRGAASSRPRRAARLPRHGVLRLLPRARGPDDLLALSHLIEAATAEGGTLVILIEEIGTDALFALIRVLARFGKTEGLERLQAFYRECRDGDLALAVAQTDVKGDRSKRPSEQDDPDMYLRVVEERADGIVARGAKAHTSCAPNVDQIIVLPSRTMGPGEEPWSVSFAVPVNAPGLRLYAADFLDGTDDEFAYPVSSRHKMVETLTVFDDVFEFHRFTAVSYKLPLLDAFVGCGIAIADANGISRAGHVREKLTWLAGYSETVRGLVQLAAQRGRLEEGIAYPDVFTTNLAKWTFARDFHVALEYLQDLAGGRPPGDDEPHQRPHHAGLRRLSGRARGPCRVLPRGREARDVPLLPGWRRRRQPLSRTGSSPSSWPSRSPRR